MSSGTILVADSEASHAGRCRYKLEEGGHRVACVSGKEELLKRLGDDPPDLVVLDLQLGGLETLGEIAQKAPHIPVVLSSPVAAPWDDFRTWLAEAVIVRSPDLTELLEVVHHQMERAQASRPESHCCPAIQMRPTSGGRP